MYIYICMHLNVCRAALLGSAMLAVGGPNMRRPGFADTFYW